MRANWKKISDRIVAHEAGFTIDPRDDGNWTGGRRGKGELKGTKYGIAANTYGHLDIKNLTRPQAVAIYKKDYWDVANLDRVPDGLDYTVADFNINSGVNRAVRTLQGILGVKQDGTMGTATLLAIENYPRPMEELIDKYMDARWKYMTGLRTFATHKNGWKTRIADVRRAAKQMCAGTKVATVSAASNPARNDKARDEDKKVFSALSEDGASISSATTVASTSGAGVMDAISGASDALTPVSYYSEMISYVLVGLAIISAAATVYFIIKRKRESKDA